MTREEDLVRATVTSIAATVGEVPPLRLGRAEDDVLEAGSPAGRARHARRARRARRLPGWLAPVTAAAVIITLAVSLVVIRDIPNGPVVPPAGTAAATGGIPPYYVTLDNPTPHQGPCVVGRSGCTATDLLVGDTLTGAKVARVSPPGGSTFDGVTAAANDRTFVVDADPTPGTSETVSYRVFYLLTIAPGTASPARLTRLAMPTLTGIILAIALSGSGRELAVALSNPNGTGARLRIYSVATGRLLHSWSTGDTSAFELGSNRVWNLNQGLSWVDGDRAVDFPLGWIVQKQGNTTFTWHLVVRTLDVTAGGSNLITDSRVVWSTSTRQSSTYPIYTAGCQWDQNPLISADGKTLVCFSVSGPPVKRVPGSERVRWRLAWLANSASPSATVRTLYQDTIVAPAGWQADLDALWTSASGDTVLGYWYLGSGTTPPFAVHFGVISHGTFRPLPTPPTINDPGDTLGLGIAW
jgi:hypothetical protein